MTRQELEKLRNEITLNSLYTDDYINSFNIDPRQVQDFFDSYLENCEYMPNYNGDLLCDLVDTMSDNDYWNELFKIANNMDYLWEFYCTYAEDPLSQEYFETYYQNRLTKHF